MVVVVELWKSGQERSGVHFSTAESQNFLEEVNELLEAVASGQDRDPIAEEAADVIVTTIGICASVGVGIDELVEQIYQVIEKNDAKTLETHIHLDGKIRRRSPM